ncbi:hypothetical protein LCGC14_1093310 [marine sediment metagenome]|uniref:Uncharacterized protein n=1 Tax=marine sediment metagenome TaxID=412755 RepID=A0A0F9PUU7_9ZZZZ
MTDETDEYKESETNMEEFQVFLKRMNKTELGEFCLQNNIPVTVDKTQFKGVIIKKILAYISKEDPDKKETESKRDLNQELKVDLENVERELSAYDKDDLKVFIKREYLPVQVTQRMSKEYVLKAVLKAVKEKKKKKIEKLTQKNSVLGHPEGTVEAYLDEWIFQGSMICEMVKGLLKEGFVETEKEAYETVNKHIEYLPQEMGIVIILTLQPDPKRNHAVAMITDDKRGLAVGGRLKYLQSRKKRII